MGSSKVHKKALTFTRAFIATMALLAIWGSSPVAATISTLIWVYMPNVIRLEEKLYERFR